MATKHTYTEIEGISQCNDCGAYSKDRDAIVHHKSCIPGDAETWETHYSKEENQPKNDEVF